MFTITTAPFGQYTLYTLTNTTTGESAGIIPSFGGNVQSLRLSLRGRLFDVLEGCTDAATLIQKPYKGAKLIPWPNRIRDGTYHLLGKDYKLPINELGRNTALHGLLYNRPLDVERQHSSSGEASLYLDYLFDGSDAGYPFLLEVKLLYTLGKKSFACETRAKNIGDTALPFADGWHPYFTLGKPIDKLLLDIPADEFYTVDSQIIPTGKERFLFDGFLKGVSFDTGFILKGKETLLTDPAKGTSVVLWQDKSYPYLQVYTPPSRSSIAIEPMSAATDAFNNGDGLLILDPGKEFHGSCGVRIRQAGL